MRCSKCGVENREGAKFCNECAAPLAVKCPACAAVNKPGAKFCDECGTALSASPQPPAFKLQPAQPVPFAPQESCAQPPEGEHKPFTPFSPPTHHSPNPIATLPPHPPHPT